MMETLVSKGKQCFINNYAPFPIVFDKGEGVYLKDIEGNQYLDFVAGIAVNALGYGNDTLVQKLKEQVDKFLHCSNLYYNEPSIQLAETLVELSGLDKVFFCNSGAEANEAAIKLTRKYAKAYYDNNKYELITMKNSFHGRTYGAITLTGQEKYHKGLSPLLPGVNYCDFNDINALKEAITEQTCGILIEPIQGEGGIRPADQEYLKAVRKLCDEHDILLIFDEVQCGIGRTGSLFAYQSYDVLPDIVVLAKGLGGGVPIGAVIANEKAAKGFEPGDHASTFGGNPLVCSGALAVLEEIQNKDLLDHVKDKSTYLITKLNGLKDKYSFIKEIRGKGLMLGIELNIGVQPIITQCLSEGLLLVPAGKTIIRFVPPLIIENHHIDQAIDILDKVLEPYTE